MQGQSCQQEQTVSLDSLGHLDLVVPFAQQVRAQVPEANCLGLYLSLTTSQLCDHYQVLNLSGLQFLHW